MEEKKKNIVLYAIIVVLLLVIVIMGVYIVHLRNNKDEKKETNNEIKMIAKQDSNRDWVYDAEYEGDFSKDKPKSDNSEFKIEDFKVPYINIDSDYAKDVNKELKGVFDTLVEKYNNWVESGWGTFTRLEYDYNVKNDILSIKFVYATGGPDVPVPIYYYYTIDLKTGNKLSYEEVYKALGYSDDEVKKVAEEKILKYVDEFLVDSNQADDTCFYNGKSNISCKNESINNYNNAVKNGDIKYYINKDGKLEINVTILIPAGKGYFDTELVLSK